MQYKLGPGGKPAKWRLVVVYNKKGNSGEHYRHICITTPVHVHVVHFSESVQHALKANCSWA